MVVNVPRRGMGTILPSLAASSASRFSTMTATPYRAVAPASAVLAPVVLATPQRPAVPRSPVALSPAYLPSYGNALPGTPAASASEVPIVANAAPQASPSFSQFRQPTTATPVATDWSAVNASPVDSSFNSGSAPSSPAAATAAAAASAASGAASAAAASGGESQRMTLGQAQASPGGHTVAIVGGVALAAGLVALFLVVR